MPRQTDYQLLKDIHESQGRLEEKFDARLDQIERRVSSLEQWKWYLMGAIVSATVAVNLFKDSLLHKLGLKQ